MNKRILIVAHKYLPQIDDDLVMFLTDSKSNISHITHSFPDAKDRISYFVTYFKGKKINDKKSIDFKFLPEVLVYLKELVYTCYWSAFILKKIDVYIGMDGLCALFGLLLKRFGFCKKVVYWTMDFVPSKRFESDWKNFIYNRVNQYVCNHSDEVWDLSPRMKEGREKYFGKDSIQYKKHKVIQNGMWIARIKTTLYDECEKNTMVFMGHLMKKQGLDMVIKKVGEISKVIPDFRLKIIGDGNYRNALEKLVRKMKVSKNCIFLGRIGNKELEYEISKSCIAIAPYKNDPDSYTYYADPGKVKTYLACGVPVLMTDLPWNAYDIQKNKCGLIIKDNGDDLIDKIKYLMYKNNNILYRKNAISYSKKYDYKNIFKNIKF